MKSYINKKFINKFEEEEAILLVEFFNSLNNNIFLTNIDSKLMFDDFEKAIDYYYKNGYEINEILDLISIDRLGTYYKNSVNNWYPLDNAAKIYPLSMKESWMSVFRISYYLKENVVPELFQLALTFTIKRFPTFRTSIRKGFFWNYIDGIKKRFVTYKDKRVPCSYINVSNLGKQSFKAVYYKNRISVEYFHILTDGYGGVVFLSSLVNEYIRLLGNKVEYNNLVLNVQEQPSNEEITDEFTKKTKTNKVRSFSDSKALELDGKLSNVRPCQLLHFDMKLDDIKKVCKEKDCTITELMLAFIFLACSYSTSKSGDIKIQVPVNMRKYYKSNTLRNFSLYVVIIINKNDINNIDDLIENIKKQMKEKVRKENLDETITYTNKLIKSLRFIPYFIKRPIAYAIYGYLGDKVLTTVLSNLGNINIPEEMKKHVEKMDFSLGTGITNKALFSMITCNDIVTLSISKFTTNSSVENSIYNFIKQNNIDIKVYGSDIYGSKK